jgi:predicted dehydrogenase
VWHFKDGEPEINLPPYPKNVIQDAIQVIREGAQPAVDGYEGKKSVALNLAIYESARKGQPVVPG